MNSSTRVATALLLSLASAGSQAQTFVTAAAGQGTVDVDYGGLPNDKTDKAFKLGAGFQFPNGLSTEVNYFDFGSNNSSWFNASRRIEAIGFAALVGYHLPVVRDFGVRVRGGVASVKARVSGMPFGGPAYTASETHTQPYFGAGLVWAASSATRVELSANFTRLEYLGESSRIRAILLGLTYVF